MMVYDGDDDDGGGGDDDDSRGLDMYNLVGRRCCMIQSHLL